MLMKSDCSEPTDFLERPYHDRKKAQKYRVFVSTWNVGGVPPSNDLNLDDWLDTSNNSYDIYVLGFQEVVPLSAKNVLYAKRSRISVMWDSLIREALTKSLPSHQRSQDEKLVEEHEDGDPIVQDFRCIMSKQMVGLLISVWVRADLERYIRHPSFSCVGCGIMGCLGNKGAVSVRFFIHETSFCIVCCHLASGGKEGDEMHRNTDATEIFSRTSFSQGPSRDFPSKILDHDRIILLGDLNYRVSLPESKTRSLVEQKEWNLLLDKDQLRGEVSEGGAFDGWHEGAIAFFPTYKYYQNSNEYYGCIDGKKSRKTRAPAWCDRILWHGKGLKQIRYNRCEMRLSDHRPVQAVFIVDTKIRRSSNTLRSFLLLARIDHYKR